MVSECFQLNAFTLDYCDLKIKVFYIYLQDHGTQGRSQTFSFGGATGGASFATRGAVNGLCRTFRKRPENFGGATGGASFATRGAVNGLCRTFRKRPEKFWGGQAKFLGGSGPPWHPPSSAPDETTQEIKPNYTNILILLACIVLNSIQKIYY